MTTRLALATLSVLPCNAEYVLSRGGIFGIMANSTSSGPAPRSMNDAINRARAAVSASDQHRTRAGYRRVFHHDAGMPKHADVQRIQRGAIIGMVVGMATLVLLPDAGFLHTVAFGAMFALILLGAPNLVLHNDGTIAPSKLVGWGVLFLFCGAMTSVAMGPTGNLWSWSPWMGQFIHGQPPTVAQPH